MCVSRVLLQNLLSQNWRKLGIIFTFLKKKNWGGAFDFFQFCMVNRFFIPRHNGQWPRRIFHPRCYPLHFFPILILEKEPVFPFWCWVPNMGTTGTIFITSLVWHGPCRRIEPETSRTRSQHYTNRRWFAYSIMPCFNTKHIIFRLIQVHVYCLPPC